MTTMLLNLLVLLAVAVLFCLIVGAWQEAIRRQVFHEVGADAAPLTVRERLAALLRNEMPMPKAERARWASARSLPDLGELMAAWLQGEIDSQPGYWGPCDVDEDLAPGLTKALVALNRAGFVTTGSQAGLDQTFGGVPVQQRAYVEGFASSATYDRLRAVLAGTPFDHFAWPCAPRRRRHRGMEMTWQSGAPVTEIGRQLSERDVAFLFDVCPDEAVDALCAAWQVTVFDPVAGRNELWPPLLAAAASLPNPRPEPVEGWSR